MPDQITQFQLEFLLFCIDYTARKLAHHPTEIYQKLKESGLLEHYLLEHYDVLHTQGKDYIVDDVIRVMTERGLL